MSIKLQDFDSKFNDISLISTSDEANRSPSAYKQSTSATLSTYISSQYLSKIEDNIERGIMNFSIYNVSASIFASLVWGFVSDRVGRKVALNVCLIGSALTMTLYAFSTSSKYLDFINALNGVFSFSSVLGSIITTPFFVSHLNDMDFDKDRTSIEGFACLFPGLIAGGINIVAYFLSYYCLNETLTDNRSKSDEPAIIEKQTDKTTALTRSKKISIFGLSLSKNSLLLLILSSLLSLIYQTYSKISQDWLTMDTSKGGLSLKFENIMIVTPLSPIIMVTILLKYPYICNKIDALKQFKAGFSAVGVLFILSVILTLFSKIDSTFAVLSIYAILYSIESGISTLRNISFDLLLTESAEVSGNLATLYNISSILSTISGIFSGIILGLPYVFKQLSTFSTENNFPFPLNCITSWFLLILSLIGYWLSSKIEITAQKNQEITREHEL
ncbi:hypothetical protein CONCODRAFT_87653 [Conidiobolus coronatus NRRL 28638]|uniref:MFS general substrate transporter n=1 Tax=Conidiobolus coronatus (strain ATCC 28846 / CBS 209.66 / NRRL 28638) TaxID=796925 RepID=A0A137NTE8_CONC2|nr:hypothetical protein CONCODRAFT_87653 [Conidiobolus coronatus NRRL 28638]|eukprot:KXN65958.1 hypothetical protein CONCODRAFT_87653 [Conidiobolus coronatus NRRL 28638]